MLLGDSDFARLRSLSRTNCVDFARVQRFLSRVFMEDQVRCSACLQPSCSRKAALVTGSCWTTDCACAVGRAHSVAFDNTRGRRVMGWRSGAQCMACCRGGF